MKYFLKTFKWHFPKPQILNCHSIGKSPCENPNHKKNTKAQKAMRAGDEQEVEAGSQLPGEPQASEARRHCSPQRCRALG